MNQIIRKPEVVKKTGLPHSTLYRLIKQGEFPKPIKLSLRASGWLVCEVDAWIDARAKASRERSIH